MSGWTDCRCGERCEVPMPGESLTVPTSLRTMRASQPRAGQPKQVRPAVPKQAPEPDDDEADPLPGWVAGGVLAAILGGLAWLVLHRPT